MLKELSQQDQDSIGWLTHNTLTINNTEQPGWVESIEKLSWN